MKKKLIAVALIWAFNPVVQAKDQRAPSTVSKAPILDVNDDDEMTCQEAAAAEAIVPVEQSSFRHWCMARISSLIAMYLKCQRYIPSVWYTKKRKKRRGHKNDHIK